LRERERPHVFRAAHAVIGQPVFSLIPPRVSQVSRSHNTHTHSATYFFSLSLSLSRSFRLYSKQQKKRTCEQFEKRNKKFLFVCIFYPFMIIYFLSRRWVFWCCWGNLVFFCTGGLIIISISGIRNVKAKGKIQKSRVRDKEREGPRTCPSGPDRLTYCLVKREREKEKDSNSRNVLSHVLRENRIFKKKTCDQIELLYIAQFASGIL
jgi:hypothetical protein